MMLSYLTTFLVYNFRNYALGLDLNKGNSNEVLNYCKLQYVSS